MRALSIGGRLLPLLLLCACGVFSPPASTRGNLNNPNLFGKDDAPHLRITFPRQGSAVFGPLTAVADAWDDRVGLKVEFFLDGVSLGTATSRPYQLPWTSPATPGSFILSAVATDSGGHTTTDEIQLEKLDQYPTIAFDTPVDGSTVLGQVPLFAMTADGMGLVSVDYSVDSQKLAEVSPGQLVIWDTTTVANDSWHDVQAVAVDDQGQRTAVMSRVRVYDGAPTVRILSPKDSAVAGGVIRLQAEATDDDSVVSVTWYVDHQPIGAISAAPYLLDWDARDRADGTEVTITAQALDSRGQTAEAELRLTIRNRSTLP